MAFKTNLNFEDEATKETLRCLTTGSLEGESVADRKGVTDLF